MLFSDLMEQYEFLEAEKDEAAKREWQIGAFVGWQQGAGDKKSFPEYLKWLGLQDGETLSGERGSVDEAYAIAEKIRELDMKNMQPRVEEK